MISDTFGEQDRPTFVDWRGVARNVASISEEATNVFHRQVKAHTIPLVEALDALPPGIKAYLLVQDAEIQRLKADVVRLTGDLAQLATDVRSGQAAAF